MYAERLFQGKQKLHHNWQQSLLFCLEMPVFLVEVRNCQNELLFDVASWVEKLSRLLLKHHNNFEILPIPPRSSQSNDL